MERGPADLSRNQNCNRIWLPISIYLRIRNDTFAMMLLTLYYRLSAFSGMHLHWAFHTYVKHLPSKTVARHHVSALCWPIGCSRCSDLKIFVQERCQLVTCFHLCCLMRCRPSTCERSIDKRNVNRSLECVVNLTLLIAPAPYTLARGQLFGKNLLEPVLQAHHCGLSLQ